MCRTIKVPEDVRKMAETFGDVPLYIVGGFVRNSILGIGETDIDLASEKLPSEVMSLFGKNAVLVNMNDNGSKRAYICLSRPHIDRSTCGHASW